MVAPWMVSYVASSEGVGSGQVLVKTELWGAGESWNHFLVTSESDHAHVASPTGPWASCCLCQL